MNAGVETGGAGGGGTPGGVRSRLPGLDGMRAFAVVWVMLLHAGYRADYPGALRAFADRGAHGVTVFFVLSGFLITALLLEEEDRHGRFSLRDFYVRRAFRILPPVLGVLAGLAVLSRVVPLGVKGWDGLACLFFFRNLVEGSYYTEHFWSLAIEEQFYLLWPPVLSCIPRRRRWVVTAGLCAFAPVWRQIQMEWHGAQHLNWSRADLLYDALLMGALLALARRHDGFRRVANGSAGFVVGGGLVALALMLPLPRYLEPGRIPLELVGIALAIQGVVEGKAGGIGRLLNWGPVAWVGRISYSLYLWQQIFLAKDPVFAGQNLPWNVVLAVGFAVASYYGVERPALRWRTRFLDRGRTTGMRRAP